MLEIVMRNPNNLRSAGHVMTGAADLTAGLTSLQFECGVQPRHKRFLHLVQRSRSLALHVCADCVFFCKLLFNACHPGERWCSLLTAPRVLQTTHRERLRVGIIGGGHLGKQLALCMRDLSGLQAHEIRISTRRPEMLRDLQERGVECFYNNAELTMWAQVLFLCCLPSQLPPVCAEIRHYLGESCIVYSLVLAVPLSRLKQLLSHSSVIRPEYTYWNTEVEHGWDKKGPITSSLRNESVVNAVFPGGPQHGGVRTLSRWVEAAVYAALNMCREQGLSHQQSLNILNSLIQQGFTKEEHGGLSLKKEDFVIKDISSSLSEESPFPWFDLSAVQTKETPFSQQLAGSPRLQECFQQLYYMAFGISIGETIPNHLALPSKDRCD